ncbi:MAG: lipid-A-disaccharide synthase [Gemmatimonadota bacterium]|nr:lipid-A-disaccharide synthase [Gemmatimonadota bacterium]
MPAEPEIFLLAGEPSGDRAGAELARALRRRIPGARLAGLGGDGMRAAGVELLEHVDRLAILGFAEVVRHLPRLARLRRRVERRILERRPALVVAIDYPGFNLPVAETVRRRGIPVLWYVVPQVWAWREGRAARLGRAADAVCAVLPFEPDFLARHGVAATFVGHPVLDSPPVEARPPLEEADRAPRLGLFPGSRAQEVRRMLPRFLAAAAELQRERPDLTVHVARAPGLPPRLYARCPPGTLAPPAEVIAGSDAAIAKSGTVTLELAAAGVAMTVGYRLHPLSFALARRLVRVPHVSLVNLVAGRALVPERIQGDLTPGTLAADVRPLLVAGSERRRAMREGLADVTRRLGGAGAADRVAAIAVTLIGSGSGR